ncbi:transmembrane protein 14A isoform 3-T3 [Rhynochetos jubatus]
MAVDWVGFAYAALLAVGGVMGYTRKGSKISLAAGLTFASVTGYGAYCVTQDPRNVKISLSCPSKPYGNSHTDSLQNSSITFGHSTWLLSV